MAKKRLPFQATKVPASQSMTDTSTMLREAGFDEVGQVTSKTKNVVFARFSGAEFHFEIDESLIVPQLIATLSDAKRKKIARAEEKLDSEGKDILDEIGEQAEMIGWRLMALHVKALADSVKLGVISRSQAFGGHLFINTKDGPEYLAESITRAIASGKVVSPAVLNTLLLPGSTNE